MCETHPWQERHYHRNTLFQLISEPGEHKNYDAADHVDHSHDRACQDQHHKHAFYDGSEDDMAGEGCHSTRCLASSFIQRAAAVVPRQ